MPLVLLNIVVSPRIAVLFRENQLDSMETLLKRSSRIVFAFALILAVMLLTFGEQLIAYTYGQEYVSVALMPTFIITVAQLVNVAVGPVGLVLIMCDRERAALSCQLAGLIITGSLGVWLFSFLGPAGVAMGVAIGLVTRNILMAFCVKRFVGVKSGIL